MFLSLFKFALPVRAVLANEINYEWYHPLKVKVSTLTFQGCLSFFLGPCCSKCFGWREHGL